MTSNLPQPASGQAASDSGRNRTLYRAVVQQAAVAGASMMETLVSSVRSGLQAREAATRDLRERDACIEVARLLAEHQAGMARAYPGALLAAFSGVRGPGSVEVQVAAQAAVPFDQLELMDELQVQASVVAARTQHMALQVAEASLTELNSLICGLLGLSTVRAERNPLRPEMYVQALREVLAQSGVDMAVQLEWLGAMAAPLGRELRKLYETLCESLRSQGVVSASYAVSQPAGTPAAPTARTATDAPQAAGVSPQSRVESAPGTDSGLTLTRLRQLLSGELEQHQPQENLARFSAEFSRKFDDGAEDAAEAGTSGFDSTVPAALEALTEMKQVDQVVQRLEKRRSDAPAPAASADSVENVRVQLRRKARNPAQTLGLEVVTLMVDNMARDARLLPPMQALVRAMEPALLRLILVDPRFFTDKQHPARVLLHEVTHHSMAYSELRSPEFALFLKQVQDVLAPLQAMPIENADAFETARAALTRRWAESGSGEGSAGAQAVEVLRHAEARNLLAERVAREWEAHPLTKVAPAVVMDFLCGPWAQVVAQARIKEGAGSVRANRFEALTADLLWSAQPQLGRENVSRLTKLVPRLLATLREGLELIQYPATRTSAFLEQLMGIHQKVFRAGSDSAATATAPRAEASRVRWVDEGNPWVAPQEAQSSNFMDIGEGTAAAPLQETEEPLLADLNLGQPQHDADQTLALGTWVEILRNGEWGRTQLTWASPHNTLFLFTNAYGITQSMTRRTRDKLVETGKLRLISASDLVGGALDAVAFTAMQNSVISGFDEVGPATGS